MQQFLQMVAIETLNGTGKGNLAGGVATACNTHKSSPHKNIALGL